MKNVTFNFEDTFGFCEIDTCHALIAIIDFLKKIEETGEIKTNDVKIDKLATVESHHEEIKMELELENAICDEMLKIAGKIKWAATERQNANRIMISSIETIEEKMKNRN